MAIITSTFGGVTLTGGAAKAFRKQFLTGNPKPNAAAQASLDQGRKMLKEFKAKGYITIKSKKIIKGDFVECKEKYTGKGNQTRR